MNLVQYNGLLFEFGEEQEALEMDSPISGKRLRYLNADSDVLHTLG